MALQNPSRRQSGFSIHSPSPHTLRFSCAAPGGSAVTGNSVRGGGTRAALLWRVHPWLAAGWCGGTGRAPGTFLPLGSSAEGNSRSGCHPTYLFSGSEARARWQPQHSPHTVAMWLSSSWHWPQSLGLLFCLFLHGCLCSWAPGAGPERLCSQHPRHSPYPRGEGASALSGNNIASSWARAGAGTIGEAGVKAGQA